MRLMKTIGLLIIGIPICMLFPIPFVGPIILLGMIANVWNGPRYVVACDPRPVRKCRWCAEIVLAEAAVCKHCGGRLMHPADPRRQELEA